MTGLNADDDNGAQMIFVCIIFLALTYFSVGLRVFVRAWITKSFQWDDWLMVIAQVSLLLNDLTGQTYLFKRVSLLYHALLSSEECTMGWVTTMTVSRCWSESKD
jgi:hypothetical protein